MRSGPPVGQPRPVPEAAVWTRAYTTLELLNGKWALAILALLGTKPRRHTDLLQALAGQISGKVLGQTLTRMQADRLVTKTGGRRNALYTLTRRGHSLRTMVTALAEWAAADADQPSDDEEPLDP
jgi:DNA-binding HxlR family transcriptional regulator